MGTSLNHPAAAHFSRSRQLRQRQRFCRGLAAVVALASVPFGSSSRAAENTSPSLVARPLQIRSGPGGATLFTTLPASITGVVTENQYNDPAMWGQKFREFLLGAIGTGVAIGDYDGDGRPDLFVVSKTETNRLFRNLGDWKFADVTASAGVADTSAAWKQGATFADVDNDGRLDLYVCRYQAPNLLYMNRGDGTFHEEAGARGLAITDACGMAAFADFDRDGWLDVFVQTNVRDFTSSVRGRRNYLFRNRGDGTFADVTTPAGIFGEAQGHAATWWDYDNDGWPDLYVANDFVEPDQLYHNNGNGTFTITLSRVLPHTPNSSMGADLGDVDNDGLIDLFVADMAATSHEKDQRGMIAGRAESREDIEQAEAAPQVTHNALFLNTDAGRYREAAFLAGLAATDWTWSPRFEDLDNDGRIDLFVTTGMVRELHNIDLMAQIDRVDQVQQRIQVMRSSPVLAESNLAFRNRGDLQFENVSHAWGLDQSGVSFGAAFGDLDGDGDLDLVFSNYRSGVTMLRNESTGGHSVTVALRGVLSNRFGVGATVRLETADGAQVRQLVLARGYLSSSEPILHFGLGETAKIDHLVVNWPSGAMQRFSDLDADQHVTITEEQGSHPILRPARDSMAGPSGQFHEVSGEMNLSLLSRERAFDETMVQPLLPLRRNRSGPAAAVGDLDGNGEDDICLGGTSRDPVRVLLADHGGRFQDFDSLFIHSVGGLNDGPVLIFDADGDGRNDVLSTKGGVTLTAGAVEYQPRLLLNQGGALFRPASAGVLPVPPLCAGAVAAADFNRDGRLDLFIGARLTPGQYPMAPRSFLLVNQGGTFSEATALAPGLAEVGMVTTALWTDVDNDGWIDLLLALDWGGVRYWHNDTGRGFTDRSEPAGFTAAGTGWWSSLAAADFNGDGFMDYVMGNAGLNMRYTATVEQPALLFAGDFADNGSTQLIEAAYDGDHLVARRGRAQLGTVLPSVLQRFPRADAYARASLSEIVGADQLNKAQRFAATELRSGVFLSQPSGQYTFTPLPRIAQIAPIQGVVAGDFDGDGHADIFAAQNNYAPIPEIGRFDGGVGQLLLGDGRGHFTASSPAASGLIVPGDARAVATLDLDHDGWPDFFVSQNNGRTLAFRNQGIPGRSSFGIRLHGPQGNPTAVGARVTVVLDDGSAATAEIFAGGGYQSQSSAELFFGHPRNHPPREIRVRWPEGRETHHGWPLISEEITISRRLEKH